MKIIYSEQDRLHASSIRISGYAPQVHEIPERAGTIRAACRAAAIGSLEPPTYHDQVRRSGRQPEPRLRRSGWRSDLRSAYEQQTIISL